MIEYKIVEAEGYGRLENGVNNLIEQGWEPVGGISSPAKTGRASRNRRVAQALIRKPENQPEKEESKTASDPDFEVVDEDSDADSEPDKEPETSDEDSEYVEASEPKK